MGERSVKRRARVADGADGVAVSRAVLIPLRRGSSIF
jgi:hypothetical protein